MIPKTIHYCWFGKNPKPELVLKCLASWRKFAPDYKIIEWNEDNFIIENYKYAKEAFERKKYAFVSDVARFDLLYHYGGIYLDTDVELIKPLDGFLNHKMFMAYDQRGFIASGLIFGSIKGHHILSTILNYYANTPFIMKNKRENTTTVVTIVSNILAKNGFELNGLKIEREGIVIYPAIYFDPYDYEHDKMTISDNTYAIHYYSGSWKNKFDRKIYKIGLAVRKLIGKKNYNKLTKLKHKVWG